MKQKVYYKEQENILRNTIQEYKASCSIFSKHGLLGWIAAEILLNNLLDTLDKVKNEEAKLFIMRKKLKTFVANGESHALLPNSGKKQGSLRTRILTQFFSPPKLSEAEKAKKNQNSRKNSEPLAKLRKELNIPKEGICYTFLHRAAESTYSVYLDPYLYSHFKLKVKNGVPQDVFGKPLRDGIYQFVILLNNEFRFLPTTKENVPESYYDCFMKYRPHHTLAGGGNVYSAGNFEIKNGQIVWLDGGSGHYGTQNKNFVDYAVQVLNSMGLTTEKIEKKIEKPLSASETFRRVKKNIAWFFKGIASLGAAGDVIQGRPSTDGVWEDKIPKFGR